MNLARDLNLLSIGLKVLKACLFIAVVLSPDYTYARTDGWTLRLGLGPQVGYPRHPEPFPIEVSATQHREGRTIMRVGTTLSASIQGLWIFEDIYINAMHHTRVFDYDYHYYLYRFKNKSYDFGLGYVFGEKAAVIPLLTLQIHESHACREYFYEDGLLNSECADISQNPNWAIAVKTRFDLWQKAFGWHFGTYLRVPLKAFIPTHPIGNAKDTYYFDFAVYTGIAI